MNVQRADGRKKTQKDNKKETECLVTAEFGQKQNWAQTQMHTPSMLVVNLQSTQHN